MQRVLLRQLCCILWSGVTPLTFRIIHPSSRILRWIPLCRKLVAHVWYVWLVTWRCEPVLLLFSVFRPYAMSELWGGGVPTSDSRQFSPRLWVSSPYSLSPTRQSKPAFQWQRTNERIHRQWQQGTKLTKDRHGGHQFTYGSSVTSLVTGGTMFFSEQPGENITQQRENSLLRVGLNIQSPLPKFSQVFETAVLNRWPRAYEIQKYFARTTSPRWDANRCMFHTYKL